MSTIETVTDDRGSSAVTDNAEAAPETGARPAQPSAAVAERRSLLVPVLSTAVGALIAGVLGLAVLGFNALRDDIRDLGAKIESEIGTVNAKIESEIGTVNAKIESEIGTVNARIESEIGTVNARIESEIGTVNARIESEIGTVNAKIDSEVGGLRADMNRGFAEVDERVDQVNALLLDHTERLARIETRLEHVETRVERIETILDARAVPGPQP